MCGTLPYLLAPHTLPMPTFYTEYLAAICWIILAIAVLAFTWRSNKGLPRIALAPLALIAALFAQLLLAPPLNPFFSLGATVFLLATAAACSLGARSRELPGVLEALAIGLIVGGLATVAIELLQLFRVPNLPLTLIAESPEPPPAPVGQHESAKPSGVVSRVRFGCDYVPGSALPPRALAAGGGRSAPSDRDIADVLTDVVAAHHCGGRADGDGLDGGSARLASLDAGVSAGCFAGGGIPTLQLAG